MQLNFPFAPVPRATQAPATRPVKRVAALVNQPSPAPTALTVAELLDRGSKVEFPKNANAVRVTIGSKTIVILKADADTLKGVGVATAVDFGIVKNDAKGHPLRKNFEALPEPKSGTTPVDNAGDSLGGVLILSLQ